MWNFVSILKEEMEWERYVQEGIQNISGNDCAVSTMCSFYLISAFGAYDLNKKSATIFL